jgi:hypothetical protein
MCKNKLPSKDSGVLGCDAVTWVTVPWKHQEPLSRHSVTFLKTQILSNTAVRTSNLQFYPLLQISHTVIVSPC